MILALFGAFIPMFTVSCATNERTAQPGPTIAEIESLTQAHVSDSVIIAKVECSGTRYNLSADQIIDLKNAGVSDEVVKAMLKTTKSPLLRIVLRRNVKSA